MVGSNKILTVSYGTFSCTLEGFDDSFHSMKAIAEYFRDLAQDDRYFGAEPPTPDAEMLARIAEREISRRVDGELNDGNIRLRAAAPQVASEVFTGNAPAGAAAEDTAEDQALASEDTLEDDVQAAQDDVPASITMPPEVEAPESAIDLSEADAFMATPEAALDVPASPAAVNPADAGNVSSFAAKLQRIRAVVGGAETARAAAEVEADAYEAATPMSFDDIEAEDARDDDTIVEDDAVETLSFDDMHVEDAVIEDETVPVSIIEDAFTDEADEDVVTFDETDEDTAETETVTDAAKDVVVEDEAASFDDASEDDAAVEATPEDEDAAEDAIVEFDAADEDDMSDPVADEMDVSVDDADVETADTDEKALDASWAAAALAQADDKAVEFEDDATSALEDDVLSADADMSFDMNDIDLPEAEDASAQVADDVEVEAAPTTKARIVRIRKDGPAEVIVNEDAEDDTSGITAVLKTDVAEDVADDVSVDEAADELALTDVVEDAVEADGVSETSEVVDNAHEGIRAAIAAAMPAGSLSDEDEDDLQAELAAVAEDVVVLEDEEPEISEIEVTDLTAVEDDVVEDIVETEVESAVAENEEDATLEVEAAEVEEATPEMPVVVESKARRRLLDADFAVTRMIAQTDEALNEPAGSRRRNAIAQLKAAVAATEAARQLGESENGTRSENAFRDDLEQVVRPSRPIDPTEEAERPRASPLKLVASQRVDGEEDQPAKSRPVADTSDTGGFAQFAASMGATELPDLLEAAAAYTSFVEGIEDFSRPQIMKKVQMTTTEEFSREDGLRSFGTLLRQGRISKVRNGRFQVSEQTKFRPDARSA